MAEVIYQYNAGSWTAYWSDPQNPEHTHTFDGIDDTYLVGASIDEAKYIKGTGLPTVRSTGTITKVEIGYEGYAHKTGTANPEVPSMRPIFGGSSNGDVHTMATMPQEIANEVDEIFWAEVTNDTNHPTWGSDWSHIQNLDAKFWGNSELKQQIFLDALYVRVTYSTDTPLTCTINQASGQADPAYASPVNFTVVFSEAVTDFAAGDVTIADVDGTAVATVTGSGSTYNIAISGMVTNGSVGVNIDAGVAHSSGGVANYVATSTDNYVLWLGGSDPEIRQAHYRWYADDAALGAETPLAAEDAAATIDHVLRNYRLRMLTANHGAGLQSMFSEVLQYSEDNGSWMNIGTADSAAVYVSPSTYITDAEWITTGMLTADGTYQRGEAKDAGGTVARSDADAKLTGYYCTEDCFSLRFSSSAFGKSYRFRLRHYNGAAYDYYDVLPTISVEVFSVAAAASSMSIAAAVPSLDKTSHPPIGATTIHANAPTVERITPAAAGALDCVALAPTLAKITNAAPTALPMALPTPTWSRSTNATAAAMPINTPAASTEKTTTADAADIAVVPFTPTLAKICQPPAAAIAATALAPELAKLLRVPVSQVRVVGLQPAWERCVSPEMVSIEWTVSTPGSSKTSTPPAQPITIGLPVPSWTPPMVARPGVLAIAVALLQPSPTKVSCPASRSLSITIFTPSVAGVSNSGSVLYYLVL